MSPYSTSSLKKENDKALKEWGTVVEALSNGIQTLLIRRRRPAHNEFFLYPTYGIKQTRKCFQKQLHDIYDKAMSSKLNGKVEIKCYSQVEEIIEVNDLQRLVDLSDHYIWTSSHVEEYFKESKKNKVYVVILRTFNLPEPKIVDVFPGLSWVNLPEPISTMNCVPVLTDADFNSKVNQIKAKLEEEIKVPPLNELGKYVLETTKIIKDTPKLNEANTRALLVEPLFGVLGWDVWNLLEVEREYSIPEVGEQVDIALKIMGSPRIFIETKRWDRDKKLDNSMAKQVIKYAKLGDVNWCVLTNGNEIRVYNASWKGDVNERLFLKLSLNEYLESKDSLFLLSKQSIEKGELDKAGMAHHTKKRVIKWFKTQKEELVNEILAWDSSLKKEDVMKIVEELIK
jgi:predicted type IV restriction endonuclease